MKTVSVLLTSVFFIVIAFSSHARLPQPDRLDTANGPLTIQPVRHGTLVLSWNNKNVYVDPVGGSEAFEGLDAPDIILLTHTHGDHLSVETLQALDTDGATFIAPQSVADELPHDFNDQLVVMANGENTNFSNIEIKAVPMYNLPDDETSRHAKGWGNGYVLTFGGKNVYISGDTEDIPEMRSLENIHVAFVCMNLPYTMDIYQAISAVLEFEPEIMYPYHYRGQDTERFKEVVMEENDQIEVRLRNWYAEN